MNHTGKRRRVELLIIVIPPLATAGAYVPTVIPVVPQWPQRKPWLMTSPAQFRPGLPLKLTSELWARDYNETKSLGGKNSARPSPYMSNRMERLSASISIRTCSQPLARRPSEGRRRRH